MRVRSGSSAIYAKDNTFEGGFNTCSLIVPRNVSRESSVESGKATLHRVGVNNYNSGR